MDKRIDLDDNRKPRAYSDEAMPHSVDECASRGCEANAASLPYELQARQAQEQQRIDAHRTLDGLIARRHDMARRDVHDLLLRVRVLSDVLIGAYGRDISRIEMIEALEREFCQGLRNIR